VHRVHQIFHRLFANKTIKFAQDRLLLWFEAALNLNKGKLKLYAFNEKVSSHGVVFNVLNLLLRMDQPFI